MGKGGETNVRSGMGGSDADGKSVASGGWGASLSSWGLSFSETPLSSGLSSWWGFVEMSLSEEKLPGTGWFTLAR